MQINLRHSKAATLHLSQILLDLDIDIVLVQEPYAKRNLFLDDIIQIPYLPDQYTVHHNLNKDHAYGAVILTKRYLMAKTIANFSSNEYIGISLFNNSKTPIHLFSVYCRPSKNLSPPIHKNNPCLTVHKYPTLAVHKCPTPAKYRSYR
jgi:hypothetical protein